MVELCSKFSCQCSNNFCFMEMASSLVNPMVTLNGFTAVCIGEKTEKTASAAGMKAVLAESVSEEGIEQALYHM